MAYTATAVIASLGEQLTDTDNDIWTGATLCEHVTEAQNLIVALRPDANAVTAETSLTLTVKQTIPSGGIRFIDIVMNTGGSPVQEIDRDKLTQLVPGWTSETGTEIEFFMHDPENPKVFWVYPTLSGAGSVDLVYSKTPDIFTTSSTGLGISDIHIAAIYEWVLYRCFAMETKGIDLNMSSIHLNNFFNIMGIKKNNDILFQQIKG